MAVSKAQYKVIKKAVIIRVKRGEDVNEAIADYPKLSDVQKADMLIELVDEGIIQPEE